MINLVNELIIDVVNWVQKFSVFYFLIIRLLQITDVFDVCHLWEHYRTVINLSSKFIIKSIYYHEVLNIYTRGELWGKGNYKNVIKLWSSVNLNLCIYIYTLRKNILEG